VIRDVLGYEGRRVVVTGCASGMGAATASLLAELGAEVIGIDHRPADGPFAAFHLADLGDGAAIAATAAAIDGPVHAVFSIAGLPGRPFSDLETMAVNFFGARDIIERLVPKMPAGSAAVVVGSVAGFGWQGFLDTLLPIASQTGFADGMAWAEANPDAIHTGYTTSKRLLNVWVAWRSAELMARGIRLNAVNPGMTDTAMMPTFVEQAGPGGLHGYMGPAGRMSTSAEQAWPMIVLNSPRLSYVSGAGLATDGGVCAGFTTRR